MQISFLFSAILCSYNCGYHNLNPSIWKRSRDIETNMAMARASSGLQYPERFYAAASYVGFDGSTSPTKALTSKFPKSVALLLYSLYQQVPSIQFFGNSHVSVFHSLSCILCIGSDAWVAELWVSNCPFDLMSRLCSPFVPRLRGGNIVPRALPVQLFSNVVSVGLC